MNQSWDQNFRFSENLGGEPIFKFRVLGFGFTIFLTNWKTFSTWDSDFAMNTTQKTSFQKKIQLLV